MSKDNPQPHHRPQANAPLAELRSIPVSWLQFRDLFEVPGAVTSTGLRSEPEQINKARSRLTYLPQIQHFQIELYKASQETPHKTVMVWVGHVNFWEPAA